MLKLSKLPAEIPWIENMAKKIVNINPTLHLNKLEIKELNLSNFKSLDILDIIPKTKLSINIGIIT